MNLLSTQYDKYYKNGDLSIYNKRFGKVKIPTNDVKIIQSSFLKILKNDKNDKIKILDFGCGDGRYFETLQNLAKQTNRQIEVISYDISAVGLQYYIEKLIQNGFTSTQEIKKLKSSDKKSRLVSNLKKDNLIFKILYGYEKDNFNSIEKLIGKNFDLVFCLFGVLSHIQKKQNRIKYIKMFRAILNDNGRLVLTVPGKGILKKELRCYSFLRTQGIPFMDATEKGDLYYKPKSSNTNFICNYHHIYEIKELENDIKNSNFKKEYSGINTILFPTKLKNKFLSKIDEYLARIGTKILPKKIQNKAAYLFIIAKKI